MKVGDSVRLAIRDWELGEPEAAMLHACNAVDGTAAKAFASMRHQNNKRRFTQLLRENYDVLVPMAGLHFEPKASRYPIRGLRPTTSDGRPDIADVIYGIHRTCQNHGDELPDGFQLIPDAAGPARITRGQSDFANGTIRLSDRVIFGLVAVAVFSPYNVGQAVPMGYHLTFAGTHHFEINEWWGRRDDFLQIAATDPIPPITLKLPDEVYRAAGYD